MVKNWQTAWRWLSVQIAALLAILPLAWSEMPEDMKAYIPAEWQPWIVSGMALAIIAGRLKDQSK